VLNGLVPRTVGQGLDWFDLKAGISAASLVSYPSSARLTVS
jgi:hypothetical protein